MLVVCLILLMCIHPFNFCSIYRWLSKILDLLPLCRNICTKKFADLCLASIDFGFINNFNWYWKLKVPFLSYALVLELCTRKGFSSNAMQVIPYDIIFAHLNMHEFSFSLSLRFVKTSKCFSQRFN